MLRRTKIVATMGPATDSLEVLTEMMRAGVDVARLNASHGTVADRRRRLALVREAAQHADKCVGVLLDLGGPKIRIECFRAGPVQLVEGAAFTLDTALDPKAGTEARVGVAYQDLPRDVAAGDTLLLNDGQIVLVVERVGATTIDTRVRVGGELSDRKGDRKSTRLNSSHLVISYAVFCLKKKKTQDLLEATQANVICRTTTYTLIL